MKRGELAVSELFCIFNNHTWLFLKANLLKNILDNPTKYFDKVKEDSVLEMLCKNVELEIVCTTIQYIELFGAYLKAFAERDSRLHKVILEYRVKDIGKFFEKILNSKLLYLLEVTGYPQVKEIEDKNVKKMVNKYCRYVKEELSRIVSLYKKYKGFYNSYKHGLRLLPVYLISKNGEKSIGIMDICNKKNIAGAKFMFLNSQDIKECLNVTSSISLLLDNSIKVFKKWAIDKENNFKADFFILERK